MKTISKLFLLVILSLTFVANVQSQRTCGSMEHLEMQELQNPGVIDQMNQIETFTREYQNRPDANRNGGVITIPVVVHVVYRTNSENISDAQVLSQIDVLNEDFRRTNSDANNQWSQAADTEIEFCMATVDPNGNATDGINRVQTGKRSFRTNDDVKKTNKGGVDAWPTDQYLNIWVCNLANGILGYAQFPGGAASTDGVVCLYNAFGRVGTLNSTYNLGRTTTHEVGHWLNLRHIWGDGGCSVDDYVSDTPVSDGANYGCASGHVSCSTVDMVENYMDYSDDACMNLFTSGQKTRMRALFAAGGFRASLASSTACSGSGGGGGGGSTPTCDDGVQNGDETGVDCGGSCSPCDTGGGGGGTGSCDVPTGLYSTARKGGREARLSWDAVGAANSYTVRLRQAGASTWNSATATGTSIDATGLTKGATYEWGVSSDCGSETSAFASATFVAGTSGREEDKFTNVTLYPNPASDFLTVTFDFATYQEGDIHLGKSTTETLDIQVLDLYGKTISSFSVVDVEGSTDIDVSTFASGMYFLRITNEHNDVQVERFIVNK